MAIFGHMKANSPLKTETPPPDDTPPEDDPSDPSNKDPEDFMKIVDEKMEHFTIDSSPTRDQ